MWLKEINSPTRFENKFKYLHTHKHYIYKEIWREREWGHSGNIIGGEREYEINAYLVFDIFQVWYMGKERENMV